MRACLSRFLVNIFVVSLNRCQGQDWDQGREAVSRLNHKGYLRRLLSMVLVDLGMFRIRLHNC